MKRRDFITLLGGAAAAWPLRARAQQAERMRRIGVLMPLAADEPESLARVGAFLQGLQELGWTDGRNVRIEYRWAARDAERRKYAAELVALAPDIILANGASTERADILRPRFDRPVPARGGLRRSHRQGFVASLARPGGSLIVTTGTLAQVHRDLIIALAARHRLPAIYPFRSFVTAGGLICYAPDVHDLSRRAAGYADRILKGEKPADLPVQAPTKYELVINLKTAKALGLEIPPMLLARADEVIE
jgi:hypothetical protein